MYFLMGYFNYLIFMLPAIVVSMWAQFKVKSTFSKYSSVLSKSNVTGASAAKKVLENGNVEDISIEPIEGDLTDNFNPKSKSISLSSSVYGSTSVASIGVAAHEAGHALQYANNYFPLKIRSFMVPATQIGSTLSFPIILLGFMFSFRPMVLFGIILFSLVVLFSIITLPVEFNASARAVASLKESDILTTDEINMVKKVLTAAAMTYVAATFTALWQLLRLILIFGGRRD